MFQSLVPKIKDLYKPSVVALILSNCIPIVGVLYFGWKVFPIVFLFWFENIIIGLFNALKMVFASSGGLSEQLSKFFLVPFFLVHYGGFTFVHGIFVFILFGDKILANNIDLRNIVMNLYNTINAYHLFGAILALILSHLISFVTNYFMNKEYKHVSVGELIFLPYGRVILLHTVIVLGSFLVAALGSPVPGLILLIILKTLVDLRSHIRRHSTYAH